ncbi:MAG: MerR family transcriptional regulator [Solobacterium sp.]|nr:MerR family transcriptional regulator [Solobacterium sp.]
MTITEVSEKFGISPDTLRYYEKAGLIPHVTRSVGGARDYQENDLQWVQLAVCLRRAGLPIEAISRYVELNLQGEGTLAERVELLKTQREELQKQIRETEEALQLLEKKIRKYEERL